MGTVAVRLAVRFVPWSSRLSSHLARPGSKNAAERLERGRVAQAHWTFV